MKNPLYLSFLFLGFFAFGQEKEISGNVSDEKTGEPLVGVTVMIKNTDRGVQADLEGNYSITVNLNDILVFSYVGYITKELKVGASDRLNVRLEEIDIEEMDWGWGLPKKPIHTATIRVTAKDIKNADNPKYNFKRNAKNNIFLVFVSELASYDFSKEELEFQEKYNVKYSLSVGNPIRYFKKHNKLTFKHLNKKYKKDWQKEIRKDAIGLDEFLK